MAWLYILRCADGSYYLGSTKSLEYRLYEHQSGVGGAAYTRRRRPVELVFAQHVESIGEAFRLEKQVQGWSRAKREALINGELSLLPQLSARRAKPGQSNCPTASPVDQPDGRTDSKA